MKWRTKINKGYKQNLNWDFLVIRITKISQTNVWETELKSKT